MRKSALSLVAVLVMLGSFVMPAQAAGKNITTEKFSVTINTPDRVRVGERISITADVTIFEDGTEAAKPVFYGISIEGGPIAVQRRGVKNIQPGFSRTITREFTIGRKARPGTYDLTFDIAVEGVTGQIETTLTIVK